MTPLSALIAAIVARVLAHRQRDAAVEEAPVPEDPRDRDSIDAWAEPEIEAPLFVGDRP